MASSEFVTFLGIPDNLATTANTTVNTASASMPASRLAGFSPKVRWRSTDGATSATLEVDLGSTAGGEVGGVYLVNHNLSDVATFQVVGDNSTGYASTELIDSASRNAWGSTYAVDLSLRGDLAWFSTVGNQSRRYWRLTITDTGNSDGYLSAGVFGIGPSFVPDINAEFGSGIQVEFRDVNFDTPGGSYYADQKDQCRTLNLSWAFLTASTALKKYMGEMIRYKGESNHFFVSMNPNLTTEAHNLQFLGRFESQSGISFNSNPTRPHSLTVRIKEVVG